MPTFYSALRESPFDLLRVCSASQILFLFKYSFTLFLLTTPYRTISQNSYGDEVLLVYRFGHKYNLRDLKKGETETTNGAVHIR